MTDPAPNEHCHPNCPSCAKGHREQEAAPVQPRTGADSRQGPTRTWRWDGDYGAEAPKDADLDLVIAEWLNDEGLASTDITADELTTLRSSMRFHVLFSVVKADLDHIDADDCGGFHSDGSGKRTMEAWFVDGSVFSPIIDAAIERKDAHRA